MSEARVRRKFDFQDFLIAAGFIGVETGVAVIHWPSALILGGALCFFFALLIERAHHVEADK